MHGVAGESGGFNLNPRSRGPGWSRGTCKENGLTGKAGTVPGMERGARSDRGGQNLRDDVIEGGDPSGGSRIRERSVPGLLPRKV